MSDAKTTRKRAPTKILPSAEYLRQCLDYDPDSGDLTWKERPREHFPSSRGWRIFNARFAGKIAGQIHHGGYRYIEINNVDYAAHRIAFKIVTGEEPPEQLDHKNRHKSENHWDNLRSANGSEQRWNARRPKNNTSGHKGICLKGTRWRVRISIGGGVRRDLGCFATLEEASACYEAVARKVHGEFYVQQGEDNT